MRELEPINMSSLFDATGGEEMDESDILAERKKFANSIDNNFKKVNSRFDQIDVTLTEHSKNFQEVNKRLDQIDVTLKEHSKDFQEVNSRFDKIDIALKEHDKHFERIEDKLDKTNLTIAKMSAQLNSMMYLTKISLGVVAGVFTTVIAAGVIKFFL